MKINQITLQDLLKIDDPLKGINYFFKDIWPEAPIRPVLKANHNEDQLLGYTIQYNTYKIAYSNYEKLLDEARTTLDADHEVLIQYIKHKANFEFIPIEYREHVFNTIKQHSLRHSSDVYRGIYLRLKSAVELFTLPVQD